MRRSIVFFAPLAAAAFVFACEDDPSSNPSTSFPEAGAFDSSRPESDAGLPDADQPDTATGPKPVTVVVATRKGPKADVVVVFHDAAGAVIESKKTGPDGKAASGVSPLPAMATAILGDRELLTWTGVQEGDVLPATVEDPSAIATYDVSLPGLSDAGATEYAAYVGRCSGFGHGSAPIPVTVDEFCLGAGAVLVHAVDPNGGPVAFASKKNVAGVTDGGTTAITAGAWAAPTNVVATVANPPVGFGRIKLTQIASSTLFPQMHFFEGSGSTFQVAPGFADAIEVNVTIGGDDYGTQRVVGKRVAPAGAVALDFAQALPELTEGAIANAAAAPKRPTITWKGTTTAAKGGVVRFVYFPSQSEMPTRWTMVVPPGTNSVQAPALPAGTLAATLPADDAGASAWQDDPEIVFADSDLLADYAAFRKVQGAFIGADSQALEFDDVVLPQNGSVKITRYRFSPGR